MPGYGDPPKSTQFQPGQSGNPDGKPKGIQNWSTLVRELLEDTNLADKLLSKKPGWWSNLPQKNGGHAIVVAMMINAMGGDVKAATWLRRTGYGDKLDLTTDGKRIRSVAIMDMRSGVPLMLAPIPEEPKPKRKRPVKKSPPKKAAKKPAKTTAKAKGK